MKLIECYIEGFGKLSDKKVEFTSGLNCINEENGSGKTTLATFIKVMLYGMSDTKKSSLDENDRKHYLPWNGKAAAGSLTFSTGAKTYRVERSFAPKAADDTFELFDLTLGKRSKDFTKNLGEELFGIDADGFERTVFLSEKALTPKSDNKSISAKLSDLVGCDGDIGDMDDALKALEDERKFYYKRGGGGELADTKAKITDINARLEGLEKTEEALTRAQAKLLEMGIRSREVKEAISVLSRERENAAVRVAKAGYGKHLKDMQAALAASIARKDEILRLFGGRAPSFEEIDEASLKNAEIKRLLSDTEDTQPSEEYKGLKEFFDGKITPEDASEIAALLLKKKERDVAKASPEYAKVKAAFSKRIPLDEELDEMIKVADNKSRRPALLPLFAAPLCLIGFVLGFFLHPALYALIGVGALLIALGVGLSAKKRAADEAKIAAFLSSVSDKALPDKQSFGLALAEMRGMISRARELIEANDDEYDEKINAFERRFTSGESALKILEKYERYAALSLTEQYKSTDRSERVTRARRLVEENTAFLTRFHVRSDDPFAELRRLLTEFNMLSADIVAKRAEIENFGALHSLGEDAEGVATLSLEEIEAKRHTLDEEAAELAREIALTEKISKEYIEALDERDELLMRKLELEELLKKHEDNYNIILLTKKYLTTARENMTVRYLGKTKEGFLRYAKEISGESEEFLMDTDFGISRLDGGSTHPTDAYSRGTRDLYNLAARLGLIDALYEGEKPFILLDDPFCSFDDNKTKAAIKLLHSFAKERQVIYFTCSKSREA